MSDHNNNPNKDKKGFSIENAIESFIFSSRWILAIFYIGLVFGLLVLGIKFIIHFYHFGADLLDMNETDTLLSILALVDTTLLANLMLIVIFSGYENFVSVIGVAQDSPDRPKWMGDIDFAGLKLKLIGSIVALSGINLLAAFLNMQNTEAHMPLTNQQLGWMVGIHITFMLTGVLFALTEKISEKKAHS